MLMDSRQSFSCTNTVSLLSGLFLICFGALLLFETDVKSVPVNLILNDAYATKIRNISQIAVLVGGLPQYLDNIGLVLFLFGVILFLFSIIMTRKTFQRSEQFLFVYISCLSFVLFALVTITIFIAMDRKTFRISGESHFKRYLRENFFGATVGNLTYADPFSLIMIAYKCCGVTGASDFSMGTTPRWKLRNPTTRVPWTCCRLKKTHRLWLPADPNCPSRPNATNSFVEVGCFRKLWLTVDDMSRKFLFGFVSLDFFFLLLLLLTCVFLLSVRRTHQRQQLEERVAEGFDYSVLAWNDDERIQWTTTI